MGMVFSLIPLLGKPGFKSFLRKTHLDMLHDGRVTSVGRVLIFVQAWSYTWTDRAHVLNPVLDLARVTRSLCSPILSQLGTI